MTRPLFAALLLCLAACSGERRAPDNACPDDEPTSWPLRIDRAVAARDAEVLRALIHPDGVLIDGVPPRQVDLVSQIEATWDRGVDLSYSRETLSVEHAAGGFTVRSKVLLVQRPQGRRSRATEVQVFAPSGPCGFELVATRWGAP